MQRGTCKEEGFIIVMKREIALISKYSGVGSCCDEKTLKLSNIQQTNNNDGNNIQLDTEETEKKNERPI